MRRLLTACLLAALLPACAQGGVRIDLDEWEMDTADASARAGDVSFTVRNLGDVSHQFLVLRTMRTYDRLWVRKGVVQVGHAGSYYVGEIPSIEKGKTETLSIHLPAGHYSLICNIAGHYENGMRAPLQVTDG